MVTRNMIGNQESTEQSKHIV